MRPLASLVLVALLAACGGGGSGGGGTPTPTPTPTQPTPTPTPTPTPLPSSPDNVIVFMIDDLSVDQANFMHPEQKPKIYTPTIDALAARSRVLTNFQTVSAICTPSRYSLITGNYPTRATSAVFKSRLEREGVAVPDFKTWITRQETTLPKRLQALGYRTGFTGKDHMTEKPGYTPPPVDSSLSDPGIAETLAKNKEQVTDELQRIGFDEVYGAYTTNPDELPVKETRVHNLDWVVDGALKFIDNNAARKFFLYVSLSIPHGPLQPARSWNADPQMTPYGRLAQPLDVLPSRSTLTSRVQQAGFPNGENFLWLDDSVSAILSSLADHGLSDRTAIVFISDHGMVAKGSIYYGGSHTAAFAHFNNSWTGRSDALTANIDVQPTILQMLGAAPAGDGVSQLPVWQGTQLVARENVFLELGYARSIIEGNYQYIAVRYSDYMTKLAARKGNQLTHWILQAGNSHRLDVIASKQFPHYFDADQLYDFSTDPTELNTLYGQAQYQQLTAGLQRKLQDHVNALPGSMNVIDGN